MRIGLVLPELLGTYGDSGNARVLHQRLAARGLPAEVVSIALGAPWPVQCDLYVLGGAEDGPQRQVTELLAAERGLHRAVDANLPVLAVCASLQILGRSYDTSDGRTAPGLGLLPCTTTAPGPEDPRMVGEAVVDPDPALALPPVVGFENHAGTTRLDPGARPFGTVRSGHGNGDARSGVLVDGCWAGRVLATYLHGPVLALNPALADLLLGWVVGELPELPPDDPREQDALAAHRARLELSR
ncbi:MAG TPA: glutamine amidotransferase [Nocardioidaceae bacterium]|nr:glutamine amidotransferase [Nocardioidaceae bacterium]